MKNKLFLASLLSGVSVLGMASPAMAANDVTLTYSVAEVDAVPTFHLQTTAINFTDGSLTQPVKFDIHVVKGNYYDDNTAAEALPYTVSIADTTIKDSHDETNTLPVAFGDDVTGTLNLKADQAHVDTGAYNGSINGTLTPNEKAGSYSGKATVVFTADVPSAKA